ncbi:hypothetical protein ASPZODRAFT_56172 [Penicilliopsis zonata CBS 506.65]|uniref:Autophagy-related protein 11 n=1 Tax=Penicilliopsis zonata CBS 506.65 TaxID=1073090 RepID=A0A1L9SWT9_9EURO|nr:hypothetical protein ASPZODRAFT_56172 [Penicilliopsis zonata CBS 506.65]OJJ51561.1 hypothetical protein ASPZODRAFT_56172 [Penicilliopsis zonata CBS 506.65]
MSLNIYIALTGERLVADPVSFASPDALRSWISRNTPIPAQRQILMTARGRNVKAQTLATETEIFVFDRRYIGEPGNYEIAETPLPQSFRPETPPDTLADQNDLQAWRNLYMSRRNWALNLSERCEQLATGAWEQNERTAVINRAVGVALENLKSHVGSLESRFQEAQAWADNLVKEQKAALDGWQRALGALDTIAARKDFAFLGRPSTPRNDNDASTGTLRDFVDVGDVYRAGDEAASVLPRFTQEVGEIEKGVTDIVSDTQKLLDETLPPVVDGIDGLLEEVETITKKISSDYEHVLGLPNNQKALANASRLALSHTKDLLPSLRDISVELQAGGIEAVQRRNAAVRISLSHMRAISLIESRLADVQAQLINLDINSDSFDAIYVVFHMPMVYGSILIESVRRREWNTKMKNDSAALAEEMAVLRDEEQRRRKKWLKNMGEFVSLPDSTTLSIEVNLQGQEPEWPEVSRKEVEAYIEDIKTKPGMDTLAEELSQLYKELDAPTRQQRRRAKAFKQGSVFDMSRSSLLLRGDDMIRSLQEEKSKLEERLKGSDSRVRKLEDLLHRQSQLGRPVSGNFGIDFPTSPASPLPDPLSRRSSVSSRRMSSNQSPEDKALVQRIAQLEAELATEKETVQRMQKEAHAERQSNTDKFQEAQSTKKDLMENLEARQQEFDVERRFLEGEVKKYRLRVEEVEEELDRTMDGHQQERQETEEQIRNLENELHDARNEVAEETEKLTNLNEEVNSHKADKIHLQSRIDELEKHEKELARKDQENLSSLQAIYVSLSPGGSAPADHASLIKAIEVISEGLSIHVKTTEENLAKALAEGKEFEERVSQMEAAATQAEKTVTERDAENTQLKAELAQEQSVLSTVTAALNEERSRLSTLQSQLAAGETGSDALRERVAEEQQKLADLCERLSDVESQARQSEAEVSAWKDKVIALSESEQQTAALMRARGLRSEDLSKQLLTQVEKLVRMLEQLGFTVTRQDNVISVQRTSKVNAASSTLGESMTQSTATSVKPDADLLNWVRARDAEEEATKFAAFMECLSQFDVDTFGEAVVKRVKDIELLARKWQKEARGYRDKYHRAQSEAHEKIAYRSFKEGDLALFLPTRNQAIRSWAAFNVGAPHYFLREQDVHKLSARDWLLARITKIEERVVDLSRSMSVATNADRRSVGGISDTTSFDEENPFELSDGLRWYLVEATEEKIGAPTTPGLSKTTVASANVDVRGSIRLKRAANGGTVAKTLTRSLDSRRNSSTSKRGPSTPNPPSLPAGESSGGGDRVRPAPADAATSASQLRETAPIFDEVRRDLLMGP